MLNLLNFIKKQINRINYDELVFDVVMAIVLSLVQFGFVAGGHDMLIFFPKWVIVVFAYFIQIVLSFNLGMIIYRYAGLTFNKFCSLLWWASLFFVFLMLFFSGMGLVVELNFSGKTNLFLYLFSFVVIVISGGFGDRKSVV